MKDSNSKAFVVSVLALILVGILGLGTLKVLGVPFVKPEKELEEPPAPSTEIVSQFSESPAWVSLNKALSTPPKGWEGTGEILTSPQAPYPFSCDSSGISPVVSASRLFSVGGEQVQVVTTAYTAGLGLEGLKDRFESMNKCQGGGVSSSSIGGIGEETYQVDVNKSDSNTKDIMFRDGDIVTYVVTNPGNGSAFNQAKTFRDHLMSTVGDKCVNPELADDDAKRNPYSETAFVGLWEDRDVRIEQFPTPSDGKVVLLNDDGTKKPEDEQEKQKAEKPKKTYPLDQEKVNVADVDVPVKPTDYPVWPLLPQPMDKPVEPESPGAQPNTTTTIQEQVEDATGPGCGWDFTGSVAPEFNEARAKVEFNQKQTEAKSKLRQESQAWQKAVLAYWKDYYTFRSDLAKWNKYVSEVEKVNTEWDKIRQQWDTYRANKAIFDEAVSNRQNFIAEKERARDDYAKRIEQCKVQDQRDAEAALEDARRQREENERRRADAENEREASPSASPEPSASPSPSRSESRGEAARSEDDDDDSERTVKPQNDEGRIECPAPRPSILDQDPPGVPAEPTPPADPRPADKRD